MRKLLCVLAALIMIPCLGAAALAEENLIKNGDFSEVEGTMPRDWEPQMWLTDAGISKLYVEPDGYEGNCIAVENVDANDARFAQTVTVEPDSLYRISAMIRAEGCDESSYGATLSIEGLFCYSPSVYETHGRWDYVEFYGRTGEDQTELTLFARVGAYGTLSTGKAWFDNIEMVKVDDVPIDAMVNDFFLIESDEVDFGSADTVDVEPTRYTEAFLLFICIYVVAVIGFTRKRGRILASEQSNIVGWFIAGLAAAMLLRVILAMRVRGYNTDINCFYLWSERMYELGPLNFYAPDYFCDYPPGYMLLLWPVAFLRNLFGIEANSGFYLVLLKMIPMLCDLAGACIVWQITRKRFGERAALALGLLYAFNPAAIVNSAAWGQIDAVLTLMIVLCALAATQQRYMRAMLFFAFALLIKPQALLFAPLGLAAIITRIAYSGKDARKQAIRFGLGILAALGVLYGVAFIFCLGSADGIVDMFVRPVVWMYELYSGTVSGYQYVTVNTLGLHYLLGLNWSYTADHAVVTTFAWVLLVLSYLYAILLQALSGTRSRRLFLTGGLLIVLICTFGPMIHERYIFPAMLLLTLAFACERDKRILISLITLTATLFMNEVLVLQGGMTSANYGHLQDSERWLNNLLSLVNVLNAFFLSWTAFDLCILDRTWPMKKMKIEERPEIPDSLSHTADYRLGLKRIDALLMCAVTLIYSVVAFANLGDTQAPQSGWTSSISGESVTFDLGDVQTFRMTYYGGICNSNFAVELSNDGVNWTEQCYAKYNQGEIFRWIWYVPLDMDQNTIYEETVPSEDGSAWNTYATGENPYPMQTARYVRITAQSAGLTLFEVGFLDDEGNVLPIQGVSQAGQTADSASSAALLIDEQQTVAAYPSYLNSTYFDEIYHARTAYEHLHGMSAYEWTHPPLGKVMMMLGIQIFGMTPFGWRFMGALVGVLMVPLMYLLVKQLTKSTKLSCIAMCLMALDSMHFTQTRIATIDSYSVFWIMLMYLFMFRYCQMNWNHQPFRKTLIPLGLCGVTMGIAWATKWIGIYASAGLAILFFWTIFLRVREYYQARQSRQAQSLTPDFWRNLWITLGFCVVFFVVIPVLIYYFSYYWLLRGEGLTSFWGMFSKDRVERVIEIQKNIFNYHAGLGGDTHSFRSPWYQWPVIWWPMWYYSGTAYMPDGVISSISCMGNPAVWWFGLAALLFVIARMCWLRRAPKLYVMVVIAFASQYLPWVIVPRSTFIYHYFASVPFIIIASVLLLDYIRGKSENAFKVTSGVLLGAALILFIMFYPLESGLPASREYAKYLRWFKWYNY